MTRIGQVARENLRSAAGPVPRRSRRAVFLDRDGVILKSVIHGRKSYAPRHWSEFRVLPGVAAAVSRLRRAGFLVIVVTNQPDIGNRLIDPALVAQMHERLQHELHFDDIELCPHRQDEGCGCRKPKPGMLLAAARRHGINSTKSFVIGDRYSDIVAGRKVGCYTILVNRGEKRCANGKPHRFTWSLPQAVRHILAVSGGSARSLRSCEIEGDGWPVWSISKPRFLPMAPTLTRLPGSAPIR